MDRTPTGLIVEDEPFFQRVLERLLAQLGISVRKAATTAEARVLLSEENFDVILVDLRMPEEDGPFLIEEIEAVERLASRALVVTAFPTMGRVFSSRLPVIDKNDVEGVKRAVLGIVNSISPPGTHETRPGEG